MRRLILMVAFVVCGWVQEGWAQTCEQVKSSQPLEIQVEAVPGELQVTVTNVHRWRVWRIVDQWRTSLVVCPLNKLTLDLRGVSTVRAGIAVRRPVRPRASNRKIISGTYH